MIEHEAPPAPPKPVMPPNPNLLRDRLANERTFLSWLRTGIGITSLGFVVARFDIFLQELARSESKAGAVQQTATDTRATIPIGVVLVLAGPLIVLLAAARYLHTERALLSGRPDSRGLVRYIVLSIAAGSLIAGAVLALHLITLWPS
jgi:putative membrane protein